MIQSLEGGGYSSAGSPVVNGQEKWTEEKRIRRVLAVMLARVFGSVHDAEGRADHPVAVRKFDRLAHPA